MGCFPGIAVKSRKKMLADRNQSTVVNTLSLYENKPVALPKPAEVQEGKCSRTVSAPAAFTVKTLKSPSPNHHQDSINEEMRNVRVLASSNNIAVAELDQQARSLAPLISNDPSTSPCRNFSNNFLKISGSVDYSIGAAPWQQGSPAITSPRSSGGLLLRPPPLYHPLPLPANCKYYSHSAGVSPVHEQHRSSWTQTFCASPLSSSIHRERMCMELYKSSPTHHKLLISKIAPNQDTTMAVQVASALSFSFEEIAAACQDFSNKSVLGCSGAGIAYGACLYDKARRIMKAACVTRSTGTPLEDDQELWLAEISRLSQLRHSNLCKLVGFCCMKWDPNSIHQSRKESMKGKELFLVYEQLSHGGLDKLLNLEQFERQTLDWPTRIKVAVDAARGLAWLHENAAGHEVVVLTFFYFGYWIETSF